MALAAVNPGDKYELGRTRVLLSGTQAIVRLALMQRARDLRQGMRTAGYGTG
jgi:indolepyruvate ferredoxin oxidoreductase